MFSRISDSGRAIEQFFPALSPFVSAQGVAGSPHGSPIFASFFRHGQRHKNLRGRLEKNTFRRSGMGQYCPGSWSVVPKVNRWTQDLVFDSDLMTISC